MANSFVKKSLPWLGTIAEMAASAIPGAGPIIALATKIVGTKLNKPVTADNISDVLSDALADPQQHQALLEAEDSYKQAMTQLGYQHETDVMQIAAQDRASARQMQVQTKSWVPGALAIAVTLGFFGMLVLTMYHMAPAGSERVIDTMTGSLGTAWIAVIMYFFGSSAGSDRKTELLANGNGNGAH